MLLVFLVAAVSGAIFASTSLTDKPKPKADNKKEELLVAHDKATIMIMGVDEREDDVGRSDTLMVATIDPKTDRASLLSIPRDTRVKIRGHGYDKINAAYAYGKEPLSQSTVENFLGVDMDYYIIVNVRAFQKIIDAIGGIDINVEKRMYYEDPWDDDGGLLIDLYPGKQHMDGKTAVTYVRYRDEEGDIGRITRQQKFMRACMDKVTSPTIIPRLPSIISEVMDSIDTDLSVRQLLEFAGTLKTAQRNGLDAEMVPGRPLYIDGISYWIPDVSKLRLALAKTLGVTVDSSLRARLDREAREYEDSIPAGATEVPSGDNTIGKAVTSSKIEALEDKRSKNKDKDSERKADVKTSERDGDAKTIDRNRNTETTERTEEDDNPTVTANPENDLRREDQATAITAPADRNLDIPEDAYTPVEDNAPPSRSATGRR
ncbi:MAG: LCP family protein [Selenomonadaceae bacterium]|nr:LCP family protein [Selenomonadaceae bacterium]